MEKAGGCGTGCLVAMPTQGLCELGKLAGNTTAAPASGRPRGERAPFPRGPPRAAGGVPRAHTGAPAVPGSRPSTARSWARGVRVVTLAEEPPASAPSLFHLQIVTACRINGRLFQGSGGTGAGFKPLCCNFLALWTYLIFLLPLPHL